MRKFIVSLVCGLAMTSFATQANADLLTDWTYSLGEATLTAAPGVTTGSDGAILWNSGSYSNATSVKAPDNSTGFLFFPEDNSGDAIYNGSDSITNQNLVSQTTTDQVGSNNPSLFPLAYLQFSYDVSSAGGEIFFGIKYNIPLYAFSLANGNTYVFYNNSEIMTSGASAGTYDGFKYGVTGIGLFVDGRSSNCT